MYNRSYDYDVLDRLISQSDNTGFKLWDYDANSNRINGQFGSTVYPYTLETTSNRLTSAAGPVVKNYSYDAAGNPLSDGATAFAWNAANTLYSTVNNGKTHYYKYNAFGQRITKTGPLSPKFMFFYDPAGQLIGEYRDNASTTTPTDDWLVRQETIWLEDIPVAVVKKPTATSAIQIYNIHADHLNTPRVIVNQSNTPVWRWENTHAFGANLPNEDPDGNGTLFEYHPRFPGQYFDKETSLHYNYFRYYEPETGRYISPDPIGLAAGMNVWGYVRQNPVSFTDPTGEFAIVGAIVGVGFEVSMQAYKNYQNGCNLLNIDNYDLWDVAWAGAAGAFAPGLLNVGKTTWKSGNAMRTIASQSANTTNRVAKNAGRIAAHKKQITDIVIIQAAYQGGKAAAKAINGNATGCGCDK